jgi:hypothetical protein
MEIVMAEKPVAPTNEATKGLIVYCCILLAIACAVAGGTLIVMVKDLH